MSLGQVVISWLFSEEVISLISDLCVVQALMFGSFMIVRGLLNEKIMNKYTMIGIGSILFAFIILGSKSFMIELANIWQDLNSKLFG